MNLGHDQSAPNNKFTHLLYFHVKTPSSPLSTCRFAANALPSWIRYRQSVRNPKRPGVWERDGGVEREEDEEESSERAQGNWSDRHLFSHGTITGVPVSLATRTYILAWHYKRALG